MENGRVLPPVSATTQRRGIVIPFRRRGINTRLDAQLNGEWDHLLELALDATARREQSALQAIRDQLAHLRALIGPDWS